MRFMHPLREEQLRHQTRRQFLAGAGQFSLGAIALEALAQNSAQAVPAAAVDPLAPRLPPQAAKAKRVIYLHMSGGPPNLDIFDGKPELVKHSGEPCPDSFLKGRTFAFTTGVPKLMGSPRTFKKYGKAGILMSDAVPNFHGLADDITLIRSMHTDQFNHAPAELLLYIDDDDEIGPDLIAEHLRRLIDGVDASSGGVDDATAGPPPPGFRHRRASDNFPTNNTMLRRAALERSGLFDPVFDRGSRADHDLGMRLHLSGAMLIYDPDVLVFHHHAPAGGLRTHGARAVTRAS